MPSTEYIPVHFDLNGGEIVIRVTNPGSPQSIAGTVDEFRQITELPFHTCNFDTAAPQCDLGKPEAINKHFFAVDGAVISQHDDPPTQYRVEIKIVQDETELARFNKPKDGPGQISDTDQYFLQKFQLVAA
ncbi:MAG: hypothetical protein ABI778_01050 [Ignavibacteriota bacterium]